MFFYLSKILWLLLAPLNLIFILMVLGVLLWFIAKKTARVLIGLAVFLFIICGFFPIGHNALVFLESRYDHPKELPEHADVIVILGGYFDTGVSSERGFPELTAEGDRLLGALTLANRYPDALILFSGGSGRILETARLEGDDIYDSLQAMGVPDYQFSFEEESRNTYQNIVNVRDYYGPLEGETWILVTSAFHMMRAKSIADGLGWTDILPYPVDYKTDGRYYTFLPGDFDVLNNMKDITMAAREFLGLVAYTVTGRITKIDGNKDND